MNTLQLELTRLIGKKELSFGCLLGVFEAETQGVVIGDDDRGLDVLVLQKDGEITRVDPSDERKNIIGHPATLTDFHRWMNENGFDFDQNTFEIQCGSTLFVSGTHIIPYDSSKSLLEQDESTLEQIKTLITNNS